MIVANADGSPRSARYLSSAAPLKPPVPVLLVPDDAEPSEVVVEPPVPDDPAFLRIPGKPRSASYASKPPRTSNMYPAVDI
jgi:hypothetical protein